ncbi:MAG: molybdopterin biosynthesis protein [Armatimonadetes bacterium]|nr:molybdopterin biosynthesis protein [Armatimonadota bacterium]
MTERQPQRRVYLRMSTVEEARQRLFAALAAIPRCGAETIPATEALGRVTAVPVFARGSSPHYCAAAMDGFAVKSDLTRAANETNPVTILLADAATPVNTGELMPEGFDAVIMIEDVHQPTEGVIEIRAAASPWQHVRLLGEDIVATELIVPQGKRLTPADVGALIASQVIDVLVVRRPSVVFVPTGSEVVKPGDPVRPGDVIDYNSYMLSGLVAEWGGVAVTEPPTPDDPDALRNALLRAVAQHDLVALIAGSSAGTHDFVPGLIEELGELLCHGVRLAPGKPTALGIVSGTPVLGVPGYSVAAWTAFDLFAKPVLARLQGVPEPQRVSVTARVRRKTPSKSGTREYLRVRLGRVGEELVAVPLKRGAGAISSLVQAEGLAIVPDMDEGLDPETAVRVELLVPPSEVERTVLAVGSHDIALDLLACHLAENPEGARLASAHVGSMGGLRALAQREAHLAGTHLLDPETEEYNVPYLRRILPDLPLKLINLAYREVGLMVLPGNSKGIRAVGDLTRDDVVIINRQRGAGTRVLLDYLLARASIDASAIEGYGREVTTHTMVAAAISGGAADTGLGIRAAATAMGLDFVPLASERYDLAIPKEHLAHPGVQQVLTAAATDAFREGVLALGGYDLRDSGKLMCEQ